MQTIGVLGLGIIGAPWAARYQAAGRLAGTWNRTPKPEALQWKAQAREVAAAADVSHIVVADPTAVAAVIDTILPALVSETRFRLATVEQAAALKLAMNLNIAGQMQALAESLTFARHAGIADDFYFQVLAKNVSQSGLAKLKEGKLKQWDFSPQFSIKHMHKDMRLAEAAASELPLLKAVRACLARAEANGLGDEDFSSLIRMLDPRG